MTFEEALKIFPICIYGGLDLLGQHKNISDLRFSAQTELDLADEGDIELSNRERKAIIKFLKATNL